MSIYYVSTLLLLGLIAIVTLQVVLVMFTHSMLRMCTYQVSTYWLAGLMEIFTLQVVLAVSVSSMLKKVYFSCGQPFITGFDSNCYPVSSLWWCSFRLGWRCSLSMWAHFYCWVWQQFCSTSHASKIYPKSAINVYWLCSCIILVM